MKTKASITVLLVFDLFIKVVVIPNTHTQDTCAVFVIAFCKVNNLISNIRERR